MAIRDDWVDGDVLFADDLNDALNEIRDNFDDYVDDTSEIIIGNFETGLGDWTTHTPGSGSIKVIDSSDWYWKSKGVEIKTTSDKRGIYLTMDLTGYEKLIIRWKMSAFTTHAERRASADFYMINGSWVAPPININGNLFSKNTDNLTLNELYTTEIDISKFGGTNTIYLAAREYNTGYDPSITIVIGQVSLIKKKKPIIMSGAG